MEEQIELIRFILGLSFSCYLLPFKKAMFSNKYTFSDMYLLAPVP